MRLWMVPLTALVAALISAGVVIGVMVWEPWESGTSVAERLAGCDRTYTIGDPGRGKCLREARSSDGDWECYMKYPDSIVARGACLVE